MPEGYTRSLVIGAEYSLWPRLGFRWIDALQDKVPDLSLRAETGMSDRLTRFLIEGVIQTGLMYTPQLRPGLVAESLLDDELILVASWENPSMDIAEHYVFADWGPEFTHAHGIGLPHLSATALKLGLGTLGAEYIVNRKKAAYIPARAVSQTFDGSCFLG
ncbi:substrate-binding domain-containing protein [Rhodobacteraceae bacterium]|nr:substrate-binding domain-containing protein [Paracoccaceae bacterium]